MAGLKAISEAMTPVNENTNRGMQEDDLGLLHPMKRRPLFDDIPEREGPDFQDFLVSPEANERNKAIGREFRPEILYQPRRSILDL